MQTQHKIHFENAARMKAVQDESVALVVTSPPYPMIEMWDSVFTQMDPRIERAMTAKDGQSAFDLMHVNLEPIWRELHRILIPGGFACINIGDATRSLDSQFRLYANHARILEILQKIGFTILPDILWRKQTNSPTKFMGSGMLPAGAYVTLEHEYILIVRKNGLRTFRSPAEMQNRRESALFWEERNQFYSDVWMDLKGTAQRLRSAADRKRSGAFPFRLAYRLICMYSVKSDWVLDPFMGTGTTMAAAMAAGRNSMGYELDAGLSETIQHTAARIVAPANEVIRQRLLDHWDFIAAHTARKGPVKHHNVPYDVGVITAQERALWFNELRKCHMVDSNRFEITYQTKPILPPLMPSLNNLPKTQAKPRKKNQLSLFKNGK